MLAEVNTGCGGAARLLAQASSGNNSTALIIAVIALIAAVAVLGSIILVVRKRAFQADRERGSAAGLMEQLRQLHREGKLSDDEFAAVIAKMKQKIRSEAGLRDGGAAKQTRGDPREEQRGE